MEVHLSIFIYYFSTHVRFIFILVYSSIQVLTLQMVTMFYTAQFKNQMTFFEMDLESFYFDEISAIFSNIQVNINKS